MRPFKKEAPYYLPLSRSTMLSLTARLVKPFLKGQSSTLIMGRKFGGGRALTKFLALEFDWLCSTAGISASSLTHTLVYVDPYELPHDSKQGYLSAIFHGLTGKTRQQVPIPELQREIWRVIGDKNLVLILRGINYLAFGDYSFWANVRSLQVYPEKVHFLFVAYDGGAISLEDQSFEPVRFLINQNKIFLRELSPEDVTYSINRWEYTIDSRFTHQERREIVRVSQGKPSLLKACCFAAAEKKRVPLEEHPLVIEAMKSNSALVVRDSGPDSLSEREAKLLALFLSKEGMIVTKEEIARLLSKNSIIDSYSDATVTQAVSRLRQKLMRENGQWGSISAIYGKGYRYISE